MMMFKPEILVRTLALITCAGALAGCGQQGSLYLPARSAASQATVPQQATQAPAPGIQAAPSSP